MLARNSVVVLALILTGTAPMRAQGQAPTGDAGGPGPISTDRPAITNSSVVVPAGSLQVENGFLETRGQGQSIVDGPESLVRFGLTKRTELRFEVPDYFHDLTGSGGSGFGDFAFGIRQQLGPAHGFDVSVIAFLSVPTGANGVSSGGYDPGLQVPWSRALSANWTAAGMFSVYWPTQHQLPAGLTRNVTGEATFLFDRQLTKPWDAFVEYAGDFPEVGGPRHLLHFGTAFKVAKMQQIDFHVGVGLSSATVDHLIGVGYSLRFQAFHRE
jgi:outer membrane putative beta-barrel porin/alpha-amylase